MKSRIIAVSLLIALMITGVIYWRHRHVAPVKKHAPVKKIAHIAKERGMPEVAIVMDDFGYNMRSIDQLFGIREPITLSILPHLAYSAETAEMAKGKGREFILHLPLEPSRKDIRKEVDTINSNMQNGEITEKLLAAIESLPGLSGVSNHMGSKSTEDERVMSIIFRTMRERHLYFFDSLTSNKSICQKLAKDMGVKYAKRDVFLDNRNDPDYIKKQILQLERRAFKKGRAIAVCHHRPGTIKVLAEMMPKLAADGIKFVRLSELEE